MTKPVLKWPRICLGIFVLIVGGLSVAWVQLLQTMQQPLTNIADEGRVFEVKSGHSLGLVLAQLARDGVIEQPYYIRIYARITSRGNTIYPGEYQLKPHTTAEMLLNQLERGAVLEYSVTFIEGWTFSQALKQLRSQPKIQKAQVFDQALSGPALAELLDPSSNYAHPEGLIFPARYQYRKGTTDISILRQAHQKLQQVLLQEWHNRAEKLPYETPYHALIMASIIEKETAVAEERAVISGVFVRRLQNKMRLQTDPTVIYGLGSAFRGNIKAKHLKQLTPYNTYRVRGLPPTPIALVGREAIHAALHPQAGDSLYFVAKGDGTHYFSSTLEEHNSAVNRFQRHRRKKNYRSHPL